MLKVLLLHRRPPSRHRIHIRIFSHQAQRILRLRCKPYTTLRCCRLVRVPRGVPFCRDLSLDDSFYLLVAQSIIIHTIKNKKVSVMVLLRIRWCLFCHGLSLAARQSYHGDLGISSPKCHHLRLLHPAKCLVGSPEKQSLRFHHS